MTASTDARTAAPDQALVDAVREALVEARTGRTDEVRALQKELVGCGMWPSDAAGQAEREMTITVVRDLLTERRATFEHAVPLSRHEAPTQVRRAHVVRVRLAVIGLSAVTAVPAAVLADGAAAVLGWLLMAMFVAAGGSFVLLFTRTDHLDVDDDLPDRAQLYAEYLEHLVQARVTLESCRPSLLTPIDRIIAQVGREITTRQAEAAALNSW